MKGKISASMCRQWADSSVRQACNSFIEEKRERKGAPGEVTTASLPKEGQKNRSGRDRVPRAVTGEGTSPAYQC